MASTVNEELTRKIAHLARLELTDAEVSTYTAQLGTILNYVDHLQKADIDGIEPMLQALGPGAEVRPFREDEARPSRRDAEGGPQVMEHSPEVLDGGYKVPPVI